MEVFLVCSYRRLQGSADPRKARLALVQQRVLTIPNPIYLNPVYWVGLRSVHLVPTHPLRKSQLLLCGSGPELTVADFCNSVIIEVEPSKGERANISELNVNLYDPIDRTVVYKGLCIKLNPDIQRKYSNQLGYFLSDVKLLPAGEKIYFVPPDIVAVESVHQKGLEYWESLRSIFQWIESAFRIESWARPGDGHKVNQWFCSERNEDLRLMLMSSKARPRPVDWDVHFGTVQTIIRNKLARVEAFFRVFVEPMLPTESSEVTQSLLRQFEKYFLSVEAAHKKIDDRRFVVEHLRDLLNPGLPGILEKLWILRKKEMVQFAKSALEDRSTVFDKLLDRYQAKPPEDEKNSVNYSLKHLIYYEFWSCTQDTHAQDRLQYFDWDMRSQGQTKISDGVTVRPYLFSRGQYQLMFHRNQLDVLQTQAPDETLGTKLASWELSSLANQKAVVHCEWHLEDTVALRVLYHENAWRHLFVRLKFSTTGLPEVFEHNEISQTTIVLTDGPLTSVLTKKWALVVYADQKHRFPCLYYEIGETGLPTSYKKIDLKPVLSDPIPIKELGIYFSKGRTNILFTASSGSGALKMGCYKLDFAQSKATEVCTKNFEFFRPVYRHNSSSGFVGNMARPTFVVVRSKLFALCQFGRTEWTTRTFMLVYCSKNAFTKVTSGEKFHHSIPGMLMSVYCTSNGFLRDQYLIRREPNSIKQQKYTLLRVRIKF